jgi:hypothetical protein
MTRNYGFVQRAIIAHLTRAASGDAETFAYYAYPREERGAADGKATHLQLLAVHQAIRRLTEDGIIKLAPINYWRSPRHPKWRLIKGNVETRTDENRPLRKPKISLVGSIDR